MRHLTTVIVAMMLGCGMASGQSTISIDLASTGSMSQPIEPGALIVGCVGHMAGTFGVYGVGPFGPTLAFVDFGERGEVNHNVGRGFPEALENQVAIGDVAGDVIVTY